MSSLVLSRIFLAPFLPQFCLTVVPGILVFVSVAVFFFLVHFISFFVVNFYLSVWINRSGGARLLGTTLGTFGEAFYLWMLPSCTRFGENRIESNWRRKHTATKPRTGRPSYATQAQEAQAQIFLDISSGQLRSEYEMACFSHGWFAPNPSAVLLFSPKFRFRFRFPAPVAALGSCCFRLFPTGSCFCFD